MSLLTRRMLLTTIGATAGGMLLPLRRAHAFPWLSAAQLAIGAAGMFVKSDSGMGAFLGALRDLAKENIKLSQEILTQVGEVQKQLAQMPNLMAEAFVTNNEFIIREKLQYSVDAMSQVSNTGRPLSVADTQRLEAIVATCSELAAKRTLPYGKRGVAATCAPLAAALDVHARKLLGRESEIPKALTVLYLDWMNQILDFNSPDSLVGLMAAQGKSVADTVASEVAKLKASSPALGDMLATAAAAGPGSVAEGQIECQEVADIFGRHQACVGLRFNGDEMAYFSCMEDPDVSRAVVSAKIANEIIPLNAAVPPQTRPALKAVINTAAATSCSAENALIHNADKPTLTAASWASERKDALQKAFDAHALVIDSQRASLSALYQLYRDALEARSRIERRITLGV